MSAAADRIWALVSGLPAHKRPGKLFFMLYAYIDDSKTHGSDPVFMLGGYLATAEQWAAFSDDWYRHLEMDPRIRYFKMWEAMNRRGEFDGRDAALCFERMVVMRQVIEKHLNAHFALAFRIKDYLNGYAATAKEPVWQNPYFFAAFQLPLRIARNLDKFGFERGPIDFIFDNQVMEKSKLIEGWEWAAKRARTDPPDLLRELILVPPYFQDDIQVLPLQAADMHVTWERINFERSLEGLPRLAMPGHSRTIYGFVETWTEEQFKEQAAADLKAIRERGWS